MSSLAANIVTSAKISVTFFNQVIKTVFETLESFRIFTSHDKVKAILICNPGNPTGYLYSQEEILKLAEIVKKHDLFF